MKTKKYLISSYCKYYPLIAETEISHKEFKHNIDVLTERVEDDTDEYWSDKKVLDYDTVVVTRYKFYDMHGHETFIESWICKDGYCFNK